MASSSSRPSRTRDAHDQDVQIGDFTRRQEIGKGSFATVYLASHRKKKSYAAIKTVHTSKLGSRLKQNLDSEIRILKQLQHPHIVALFACLESPGNIHIVMEYCQMSDLAQFMKSRARMPDLEETANIFAKYPNAANGGLNEVLARHFIKQTASGMRYLREKHIVHRDLKPQNLLLNPPPTFMQKCKPEDVPLAASEHSLIPAAGIASLPMLKIADFGFARHLPAASLAETLCGSPLYMAPEILNYQKYDAKADLWSVGTIAFEMIVGKPPFRANNHIELLKKIKAAQDVIPFPAGLVVSREYKTFIRSLLKQDPVQRASFERYFQDPVVVNEIPGLVGEDIPQPPGASTDLAMSQLSDRLRKQAITSSAQDRQETPVPVREPVVARPAPQPARFDVPKKAATEAISRKGSGARRVSAGLEQARPASENEHRRPSISHHPTAPGPDRRRQDVEPAPEIYRRVSHREPTGSSAPVKSVMAEQFKQHERALRKANPRTTAEDDIAFEREWVKVDKQATEVNALADELENRYQRTAQNQSGLVRRATTQGSPTSVTGAQPSTPSNAMQIASGRRADTVHARQPSYERRYAPNPSSFATSALHKVLNAANARLFGSVGTSPPFALGFGKGPSPPQGYGAFPQYPAPLPALLTDGRGSPGPQDEDSRMCRAVEQAATRSDVVYGFAEVKYRQLLPATPSAEDGFSIRPISDMEPALDTEGKPLEEELTQVAIAAVAEEAFVLYVKALSILLRTINLVRYWWERHRPAELQPGSSLPTNMRPVDASKRMNNVVQWARNRFNECLEKSEVVSRRLIEAQKQLPASNPGHPSNHKTIQSSGSGSGNNFGLPLEQIYLTSGVTAERLMYERALEMSRAAAINELTSGGREEWHSCELSYVTAVCLYEAVLENDDELSFTLPSESKVKFGSELINGLGNEDRAKIIEMIKSTRDRLESLRKKIAAFNAQQNTAKRLSTTSLPRGPSRSSSNSSPVPTAGTPPR